MSKPNPLDKSKADTVANTLSQGSQKKLVLAQGEMFGPYEIINEIAKGGMGQVFLARDTKFDREVALKALIGGAEASKEARERFIREAKLLSELNHHHIIPVHDFGLFSGVPYYTMDFVVGHFLTAHLADRKLPLKYRLEIFLKICDGVQHAHRKGVIHRDLKPENILVKHSGDPIILDFGIAHLHDQNKKSLTLDGSLLGTPNYMAPEQVLGKVADIDVRTDVYALGVILFEMITNHLPIEEEEQYQQLQAVVEKEPTKPSAFVPVAKDLEAVILKAIAKDRDRRYESVRAFMDDIRAFQKNEPVQARPESFLYISRKWMVRHKETTAALVLLLVLGVWAGVQVVESKNRALLAQKEAESERDRIKTLRASDDLVAKAHVHMNMHNFEKARFFLKEAELLASKNPKAYLAWFSLFLKEGHLNRALEAIDHIIRLETDITITHRYRLFYIQREGRLPEFVEALERMMAGPQHEAIAIMQLAESYLFLGKRQSGVDFVSDYVKRYPKNKYGWFAQNLIFFAVGKHEEGVKALDKALALDPEFTMGLSEKGRVLRRLKRLDEALHAHRKSVASAQTHDAEPLIKLALFYQMTGKHKEALSAFDLAVKKDPHDVRALVFAGMAQVSLGDQEKALALAHEAIEKAPSLSPLFAHRSWVLSQMGRLEEALESARLALDLNPYQHTSYKMYGLALQNMKKYEEAILAYNQALRLSPNLATVTFLKAQSLDALGQNREALRVYQKAYQFGALNQKHQALCEARMAVLEKALGPQGP